MASTSSVSWPRRGSRPAWRARRSPASGPLGVAIVLLAPFLLVLRSGHVGRLAGALAVACAIVGAAWSVHGIATRAADPLRARIGHVEQARLVIEGQPRPGPFGSSAIARLDGHPIELRSAGTLQQGAIVEVSGRLAQVPPSPQGFDRRTWLARQGVHEALAARSLAVLGRRGGIQGVLDRLRHGARTALQAGGDDESSRIATGVALGGTATLDDSTVEAFRASGLAHLLAVSGGNVVLLVAAVLGLAWLARVPRPLAHGCAIPGGDRVRRDRGRRAVGRACRSDGRAGVPGLAGRLRARPLASARPRGGGGARARSVGDRRPGLPALFRRRRRDPWPRAAHSQMARGDGRAAAAVLPARDLGGLHARNRPGRTRAFRAARRSSPACPPTCSRCPPWHLCSGSPWRPARSGRSRPGRQRCSTVRCERSAPTSAWSRTLAPGSTARCPGACCSSCSPAAASRGSPAAGRPPRSRARSRGCWSHSPGPPREGLPRPRVRLRVTFLDVGQGTPR